MFKQEDKKWQQLRQDTNGFRPDVSRVEMVQKLSMNILSASGYTPYSPQKLIAFVRCSLYSIYL